MRRAKKWPIFLGGFFSLIFWGIIVEAESKAGRVFGGILLSIALISVISGIVSVVSTRRYNNALIAAYRNVHLITDCPFCNRPVETNIERFVVDNGYPEGFIVCPVCKKRVSRNAFPKPGQKTE